MRASVGLGSLNGCIGTASGRMAACGGGSWLGSGNVCCNDREDGLAHCQSCPWPTCVGWCFLGSGGVASAGRRGACCDVSPGIDGRREAGDSDKCARPPCQHGKRVCWCWRGEGRMLVFLLRVCQRVGSAKEERDAGLRFSTRCSGGTVAGQPAPTTSSARRHTEERRKLSCGSLGSSSHRRTQRFWKIGPLRCAVLHCPCGWCAETVAAYVVPLMNGNAWVGSVGSSGQLRGPGAMLGRNGVTRGAAGKSLGATVNVPRRRLREEVQQRSAVTCRLR